MPQEWREDPKEPQLRAARQGCAAVRGRLPQESSSSKLLCSRRGLCSCGNSCLGVLCGDWEDAGTLSMGHNEDVTKTVRQRPKKMQLNLGKMLEVQAAGPGAHTPSCAHRALHPP